MIKKTVHPIWDETYTSTHAHVRVRTHARTHMTAHRFSLSVEDADHDLIVDILDHRSMKTAYMGKVRVPLQEIIECKKNSNGQFCPEQVLVLVLVVVLLLVLVH